MVEELPTISLPIDDVAQEVDRDFEGEKSGWMFVGDKKYFMRANYLKYAHIHHNFKARSDDVWIFSIPRAGCTFTGELTWLLGNDMDFSKGDSETLRTRFPFFEFPLVRDEKLEDPNIELTPDILNKMASHILNNVVSPRFIRTHLPLSLVPNVLQFGCKVIYIARNPKDLAISRYYLSKNLKNINFKGDFEAFWNYFEKNLMVYTPYWEHVKEAWSRRNEPNFLFIFYEELINDQMGSLKKMAEFLGKSYSDEQLKKLADHLEFSKFKNNKMVNAALYDNTGIFRSSDFIRQGKSGDWHKMFTPELNTQANRWIEENIKDTPDLIFPYVDLYA